MFHRLLFLFGFFLLPHEPGNAFISLFWDNLLGELHARAKERGA